MNAGRERIVQAVTGAIIVAVTVALLFLVLDACTAAGDEDEDGPCGLSALSAAARPASPPRPAAPAVKAPSLDKAPTLPKVPAVKAPAAAGPTAAAPVLEAPAVQQPHTPTPSKSKKTGHRDFDLCDD
ncbi:hypothetical protein [Streptomyces sp. H27-H5]|uniref:hypothetical protein n=1 Tax=Streptomyces sp. H27-H5 TaxID=2996460 RepID=UPI00226ED0E2|nr:hypothetical protein [Streptomyces sp. H27-H5]MCY0957665.1 hypothetical protein [Streptomyces sp. H27-H5]